MSLQKETGKSVFGADPFREENFDPDTYHHPTQDTPEKLRLRFAADLELVRTQRSELWQEALETPTLPEKIRAVVKLLASDEPVL